MQRINQMVPVAGLKDVDKVGRDLSIRLDLAAETLCRLSGLTPDFSHAKEWGTNRAWARTQVERAFWIAESLRIAGLGGTNAP